MIETTERKGSVRIKIIDKVVNEGCKISKEELIESYCPSEFGYNQGVCCSKCEECWNREVKE